MNLFIRSAFFSTVMIVATFLQSIICILVSPLPLRYRYKTVTNYTRFIIWLLKIICHIDYQIHGLENIPQHRNGVILCKHQSTWETFFLPGLFPLSAIILKRELLWVPFFGWGLATISPIAIDRSKVATAMEQIIKKGKKCLDAGRWIVIFPEGTRIPAGKTGKFHSGGARLAVTTGYPIVPIAHNAGHFWARRKFIKQPGTIQVVIGPLIETGGRLTEDVMLQVKNWIETTMAKIEKN